MVTSTGSEPPGEEATTSGFLSGGPRPPARDGSLYRAIGPNVTTLCGRNLELGRRDRLLMLAQGLHPIELGSEPIPSDLRCPRRVMAATRCLYRGGPIGTVDSLEFRAQHVPAPLSHNPPQEVPARGTRPDHHVVQDVTSLASLPAHSRSPGESRRWAANARASAVLAA
jgi:hypothetical protein